MKFSLFVVALLTGPFLAQGAENSPKPAPSPRPPINLTPTAAPTTNSLGSVPSELKDKKDRTSYAIGMSMGQNLKRQSVDVNLDLLIRGIKDSLAAEKVLLTDEQMRDTFKELQTDMQAKMQQRREEQKTKNKGEGEQFLAENAKKEGVMKLPDGLQYKIIKEGSGPSPKATDRVSVKYTGKLINGTVFDSTDKNGGRPTNFRVDGVIKGWTEALQKMKKGAQWELFIPSDLAYGENGNRNIEPNSTLIFNVELVDILPSEQPPAPSEPVTSDIIKVPSADELKKGAKIEVLKPEDVKREIEKQKQEQGKPNPAAPKK
jgi:FKBP-type peptidyl-prolyl cis-trans isomerase FklB